MIRERRRLRIKRRLFRNLRTRYFLRYWCRGRRNRGRF